MNNVTIICDRCKASVEGYEGPEATGGFYGVREPGPWAKYARPGETKVCDDCMWSDPGYIADYGDRRVKAN